MTIATSTYRYKRLLRKRPDRARVGDGAVPA
jgi:hypothetical protein